MSAVRGGGKEQADGSGAIDPREATPLINAADTCVAALLLALCAYLYYVTTGFEETSDLLGENVLPEEFPRLLLYLIGGLALLLPVEHHLQPARWRKIHAGRSTRIEARTWMTIGFIVAVVVTAPYLGTLLTMVSICTALPILWGERRWYVVVPFAVIFNGIVAYLFTGVLGVYFEPGLLTKVMALFA